MDILRRTWQQEQKVVYLLRFNPFMDHEFKKWTHLKSLPGSRLRRCGFGGQALCVVR